MGFSFMFPKEYYHCDDCEKDVKKEDLPAHDYSTDWACPECKSRIINATDGNEQICVRRLFPHDIQVDDIIELANPLGVYPVKKIKTGYKVWLGEPEPIELRADQWLNVSDGMWH